MSVENFIGGSGADTITGDTGNNTLTGGLGADNINGGGGNDTIFSATSTSIDDARDVIDGGPGSNDTANYSAYTTNLTVTLSGSTPAIVFGSGSTVANSDTIMNIENFIGGSGNDTITGDGNNNFLTGGLRLRHSERSGRFRLC